MPPLTGVSLPASAAANRKSRSSVGNAISRDRRGEGIVQVKIVVVTNHHKAWRRIVCATHHPIRAFVRDCLFFIAFNPHNRGLGSQRGRQWHHGLSYFTARSAAIVSVE